ncbi:MAG: SEC-C domain-containing protein, partial [Candidatus Margulisbacteria bacterium]|nr:SEC-C domain-containing protein [Candidatus Margulisiibacteriota bacterium]
MAGRGVDIILGGNPPNPEEFEEVKKLGGLHVMGTERHEARRIDNQLRGRSGRQGDPGSSKFYVSLEDDLMRLFGSGRIAAIMDRLGMEEDTPIEHNLISRALENAQKKVEEYHFSIRKQVLEFDDVMNKQRETIYTLRRKILEGASLKEKILEMMDTEGMGEDIKLEYARREEEIGPEAMRMLEKIVMLRVIDQKWIEQLHNMDHLKEGVGLRGYGGKDPVLEYKIEGYKMFQEMMTSARIEMIDLILKVQVARGEESLAPKRRNVHYGAPSPESPRPQVKRQEKVGRNDPCPCGSGKKYKKCCGKDS